MKMYEAFNPRDIAKNAVHVAVAATAYKYTKQQMLQRTEHDQDDITVKVVANVAGSSAAALSRRHSERYIDWIADRYVARKTAKQNAVIPEVPTKS